MLFLIDIVGTCNLRCPSCPVGNMSDSFAAGAREKGFMDLDYFKAVVEKAQRDCRELGQDFKVALYNWGESLIHPKINEIVEYLHNKNIEFDISSNFNVKLDLWRIVMAKPKMLRVSLSGGTNSTYQKSHAHGDVNLVISNLYYLRHLLDKSKRISKDHEIYVQIYYHLYRDNCGDDISKIYNLCLELNFDFVPGIAYFMPLEKMMYGLSKDERFSSTDKATADRMYIPIDAYSELGKFGKSTTCSLRNDQVVINHNGSVPVCCGVYDPIFTIEEDYLNADIRNLQKKRNDSEICKTCMQYGLHDVAIQNPIQLWNAVVREEQLRIGTKFLTNVLVKPCLEINPIFAPTSQS